MEIKPIFTVGIPGVRTTEEIESIQKNLERRLSEYHVLVYAAQEIKSIKFEAFNPKEINDIDLDELRQLINDKSL